eukprot:CAMPEP_0181312906 /NCGR_PEP_ID=MMETSP1101-20121128/13957_1 /TAXON_ID=46948 /ORGANISM="Rhodomonas abbreviata, Strain Caron Lab Isolate" /LENGTH=435 /DNA_ID=CAMNT_0023419809 /DNA_START=18 /DNA_END=1326 /DNA_ORIENTATION=-
MIFGEGGFLSFGNCCAATKKPTDAGGVFNEWSKRAEPDKGLRYARSASDDFLTTRSSNPDHHPRSMSFSMCCNNRTGKVEQSVWDMPRTSTEQPGQPGQFLFGRLPSDEDFMMSLSDQGQFIQLKALMNSKKKTTQNGFMHTLRLNVQDSDGNTALHKAAKRGYDDIVQLLVENGALSLQNNAGLTPANVAAAAKHKKLARKLDNLFKRMATTTKEDSFIARRRVSSENQNLIFDRIRSEAGVGLGQLKSKLAERRVQSCQNPVIEGSEGEGHIFQTKKDEDVDEFEEEENEKYKKQHHQGETAIALFDYQGISTPPFPPDKRTELTVIKGQKVQILDIRDDGWCVVKKPTAPREYYLPGNFISVNGKTPVWMPEQDAHGGGKHTGAVLHSMPTTTPTTTTTTSTSTPTTATTMKEIPRIIDATWMSGVVGRGRA